MKMKTQVKAGQVTLVGIGIAGIGQASGGGNNTNNGQIGAINIIVA
jgi:hypothetical protein